MILSNYKLFVNPLFKLISIEHVIIGSKTQWKTMLPDSIVGRRMACQSDIHVAALGGRQGDCGAGNLPNSERCGGSRLMAGDSTYTIAPP